MTQTDAALTAAPASRWQRIRLRWQRPAVGAVLVWLAVRIVLYTTAIVTLAITQPKAFSQPFWLSRLFYQWDAVELVGVAQHGYFGPGLGGAWPAYFPGYPLAIRGLATVLFGTSPSLGQLTVAATIVVLVASLVAGILLWRIVADRFGDRIALAATVLFFAGPYSVFLVASYSEALFIAFGLAAWLCASRGRWISAGVFGALATVTRINGVFLVVGMVIMFAIIEHRAGRRFVARAIAMAAMAAAGVIAYFVYLYANTGDLLAWSHAQQVGWGRVTQWPWNTLKVTLLEASVTSSPFHLQYRFDLIFAALMLLGFIVLLVRRWWPEAIYIGLTGLSLATSLSYLSLARNTLLLFPLVMLVAASLLSKRYRWVFWVVLVLGVGLMLFTTTEFVQGHWAD